MDQTQAYQLRDVLGSLENIGRANGVAVESFPYTYTLVLPVPDAAGAQNPAGAAHLTLDGDSDFLWWATETAGDNAATTFNTLNVIIGLVQLPSQRRYTIPTEILLDLAGPRCREFMVAPVILPGNSALSVTAWQDGQGATYEVWLALHGLKLYNRPAVGSSL
jgi:hypothetical protein